MKFTMTHRDLALALFYQTPLKTEAVPGPGSTVTLSDAEQQARVMLAGEALLKACVTAASAIETATQIGVARSDGLVQAHAVLLKAIAKAKEDWTK